MSENQVPAASSDDRRIDPDVAFGPGASPQYHEFSDAEVVTSIAAASLKLDEMANDPHVSGDVVAVLRHLRDAVRNLGVFVGIDFD